MSTSLKSKHPNIIDENSFVTFNIKVKGLYKYQNGKLFLFEYFSNNLLIMFVYKSCKVSY